MYAIVARVCFLNDSTTVLLFQALRDVDDVEEYVIARKAHADCNNKLPAHVEFRVRVKLRDAPIAITGITDVTTKFQLSVARNSYGFNADNDSFANGG